MEEGRWQYRDSSGKTKERNWRTEKIKFLQEAAIMGQLMYPSEVTMYGVVIKDEPVSNEGILYISKYILTIYSLSVLKSM